MGNKNLGIQPEESHPKPPPAPVLLIEEGRTPFGSVTFCNILSPFCYGPRYRG